jgi:tRNA (cmo5U34)-methyltransferase
MHKRNKDQIYAQPLRHIDDFNFDSDVAAVFEDMIRRSVPGYESVIPMMSMLAETYARPGTNCYDLGSSLGATAVSMARGIPDSHGCRVIAVDRSHPMVRESLGLIKRLRAGTVSLICADIRAIRIKKASFVALNYTLQFLPPEDRLEMLRMIYQGLIPGGALALSEKIIFENDAEQNQQSGLHFAFKKFHGYSDLEISQKRTALEHIMKPETLSNHMDRLNKVGFRMVLKWFQCFNFVSIIAVK